MEMKVDSGDARKNVIMDDTSNVFIQRTLIANFCHYSFKCEKILARFLWSL